MSPEVDPAWGHNKPTGGIRYTDLEVPVRRLVKIDGREYVLSLLPALPGQEALIEFRQRRKHARHRFSLASVLIAAARETAAEEAKERVRERRRKRSQ